ncbi:sulfur oxidation c-type cytochrome SoxA [Undibacter mobilis]|uniref:L-cysteine S-thiosulfotransferase subunit SoxA n=2 Tax=Undibacter mobilis TaxID=2292256 RepID=A0A371BDE6_9BRAD|nr:sulfur oxidation c-type cytochrome SoxA [Undibacter mobilis]
MLAAGAAAVVALVAGVVTLVAPGAYAQAKKEAPLVTDGDAAARPWKRYNGWPARDYSKFNTLANLASPPAPKEPRKIAGPIVGDAKKGAELVADRNRGGSCLACHVMGPAGGANLPGNVAPDLSEIGNAGREDEWLFNYINDARVYNPETVMPPWGSHGLFTDDEIKDMVAFLKTLKAPAVFKTALDNPEKRSAPVEKRENLDPLENPAMWAVDKAQELWKQKTSSGFSCNTCHSDPASQFKTWAASMPKWEPRVGKVLGVEEFVTRHAKATTGANWPMETDDNRVMSVYLHFLANGQPIKVDTGSEGAKAALARGKELSARKVGQLNFACTDCHGISANKWIRGQWLGEPKGQYDHFPTWRTSLQAIWDIRQRFQWCSVNIRGDELPPDAKEYGDLELYLASQNEGLKLSVPGIRH